MVDGISRIIDKPVCLFFVSRRTATRRENACRCEFNYFRSRRRGISSSLRKSNVPENAPEFSCGKLYNDIHRCVLRQCVAMNFLHLAPKLDGTTAVLYESVERKRSVPSRKSFWQSRVEEFGAVEALMFHSLPRLALHTFSLLAGELWSPRNKVALSEPEFVNVIYYRSFVAFFSSLLD